MGGASVKHAHSETDVENSLPSKVATGCFRSKSFNFIKSSFDDDDNCLHYTRETNEINRSDQFRESVQLSAKEENDLTTELFIGYLNMLSKNSGIDSLSCSANAINSGLISPNSENNNADCYEGLSNACVNENLNNLFHCYFCNNKFETFYEYAYHQHHDVDRIL